MKKRTLITGATSGIGLEIAEIMAARGHDLVLVARREDKLLELKADLEERYEIEVDIFVKDLSQKHAAHDIYDFTYGNQWEIDILVNNAGFGDYGKFYYRDLEKQTKMVQVNVIALMELTYLYLPDMLTNSKGRILNVSSMAAFQPGPLMSVYYATKAFVLSFTEALSMELRGTGVRTTALCPGPTRTEFGEVAEFRRSRLLKNFKGHSARFVAEYGINALFANSVISVPGLLNKALVVMSKLMPRCLVRRAVYQLQKE